MWKAEERAMQMCRETMLNQTLRWETGWIATCLLSRFEGLGVRLGVGGLVFC